MTALDEVLTNTFKYTIMRKELLNDPKKSAQIQANKHLADFVYDHDGANTLLIIYYAGHGLSGGVPVGLYLTGSVLVSLLFH